MKIEQILAHLMAKIDTNQEKMDNGQEDVKSDVVSLTSWIDVSREDMRARVSAIHYKMEVTIKCSQEETKAANNSIRAALEKAIKHRVDAICHVSARGHRASTRNLTGRLMKRGWTYWQ
jgi:predicted RNA-binding protein